ncbi:MAG: serine protease [Proteobacteria bacterium]|nr:serine protease [Pseudomonadota bacterium]MBI3495741.1 serine protease [Pseudomonadota bacterium]
MLEQGRRALLIELAACLLLVLAAPRHLAAAQPASAEEILASVVAVHAKVPGTARTAKTLGNDRRGNGVVIANPGGGASVLVLTIGYLVIEADEIEIIGNDERAVPASLLAYDPASGFGLLRPTAPIDLKPIELGDSASLGEGAAALVAGHGGAARARAVRIVSRRTFAGAWEYLVDEAIFTAPPYGEFGGAALIATDGKLVGIGSLILSEAASGVPGNMFVPTDRLKPILADMVAKGRPSAPPRPWLGINTQEVRGQLFVTSVSADGPAARAGIKENDVVLAIHGRPVEDLADLYRKLWAEGPAGTEVPVTVLKGRRVVVVPVPSADRTSYLRLNPTY